MISPHSNPGSRSHAPYPPPIDMTPVDAHRLHLHLQAQYYHTGESVFLLSDFKHWPKSMDLSRQRFKAALDLLGMLGHIHVEKTGKVSHVHLSVYPVRQPYQVTSF